MKINLYPAKNGVGATTLGIALAMHLSKEFGDRDGKPTLMLPDNLDVVDAMSILALPSDAMTVNLWGTMTLDHMFLCWGPEHVSNPIHSQHVVRVHTPRDMYELTESTKDSEAVNILVVTNNYSTLRRALSTTCDFTAAFSLHNPTLTLSQKDIHNVVTPVVIGRSMFHSTDFANIHRTIEAGLFSSRGMHTYSEFFDHIKLFMRQPAFFGKEMIHE